MAVLALSLDSNAETVGFHGQSSIDVRIGGDSKRIHKINRTFDVIGIQSSGRGVTLVLDQTVETQTEPPLDGYSVSSVVLKAFELAGEKRKEQFTIREKGQAARRIEGEPLFLVSDWGCCSAPNTHSVYSLISGKRLFFTGGGRDPFILNLDSGGVHHFVGVHASGSARDKEIYHRSVKGTERLLLVTYASPAAPVDTVLLSFGEDVTDEKSVVSVRWVAAPGVSSDGSYMSGSEKRLATEPPIVEISVHAVGTIKIPIRNGRFDESSVGLPTNWRIERRPIESPLNQ